MKKLKKLHFGLICVMLALVCGTVYCLTYFQKPTYTSTPTRNIEVTQNEIDYQSILEEFDNSKLETSGSLTTFEGYQKVDASFLSEIDNLSESDVQTTEDTNVKYNFSYDAETNIVTLSAELKNELGEVLIEEIQGIAFINEMGEIDAILDLDGDFVLLSEMQDSGLIQNCGWFKKAFKKLATKIVVATVAVVAVAAVVSVVVATAGAGLGAVIAAGAVAGGVTGGIAGGVISYQETGAVQIWAVAGGIIGGAAIGGLTGWAVGTIMGVGSQATCGFAKGSFNSADECLQYHFNKHGAEVGAKTVKKYSKMAAETAQKVISQNLTPIRAVSGATQNVFRYEIGNYYIHMAHNAKEIIIVSFGLL